MTCLLVIKIKPLKVKHPCSEDDFTSIWFVSGYVFLKGPWPGFVDTYQLSSLSLSHIWCDAKLYLDTLVTLTLGDASGPWTQLTLGDAGFLHTKPLDSHRLSVTWNEYQTKLAFWALFQVSYNQSLQSTNRFKRFSGLELLLPRDAWAHLITPTQGLQLLSIDIIMIQKLYYLPILWKPRHHFKPVFCLEP